MAIYAYVTARRLLRLSDHAQEGSRYPTPHQTSVLLQILNAELLALCGLVWAKMKEVFWASKEQGKKPQVPRVLWTSIAVFAIAVVSRYVIEGRSL